MSTPVLSAHGDVQKPEFKFPLKKGLNKNIYVCMNLGVLSSTLHVTYISNLLFQRVIFKMLLSIGMSAFS